jgi:hypothetical protein
MSKKLLTGEQMEIQETGVDKKQTSAMPRPRLLFKGTWQ